MKPVNSFLSGVLAGYLNSDLKGKLDQYFDDSVNQWSTKQSQANFYRLFEIYFELKIVLQQTVYFDPFLGGWLCYVRWPGGR